MSIKIMLDAGHYGKYNHSPVVDRYWESEMTWKLHLFLKGELEQYGFEVLTTRKQQELDKPLYDRGYSAKECDLFISLHSDASNTESVNRVNVFKPFDLDDDPLSSKLAAGIAELMEVSYGRVATRRSGNNEYYGVMRGARKAKVPLYYIIEHSFHTNKYAAEWLLNEENLKRLAVLEAGLIADHYGYKKTVKGDVNGDGKVDAKDYLLLRRYLFGKVDLVDDQLDAADVNGDGKVDALDVMKLKRAIFGMAKL